MSSSSAALSERMEAIIGLIPPCESLADIGCDHAYISIAAVERGIAKRVYASDVRPGPLKGAKEHIEAAGLSESIEIRLADGLSGLSVGEAQVILICGMGGRLITDILEAGADVARSAKRLIIGAQSDLYCLRRYLREKGYVTVDEDMVLEDGKYYALMSVIPGGDNPDISERGGRDGQSESRQKAVFNEWGPETEYRYGSLLLSARHPLLRKYLEKRRKVLTDNISSIEKAGSVTDKKAAIETELKEIEGVLLKWD